MHLTYAAQTAQLSHVPSYLPKGGRREVYTLSSVYLAYQGTDFVGDKLTDLGLAARPACNKGPLMKRRSMSSSQGGFRGRYLVSDKS